MFAIIQLIKGNTNRIKRPEPRKLTFIFIVIIIDYTVLETPHVAVGAAIASKIPNPFIAVPLAFASHFVLEKVPHWNPHLNTEKKALGKISNNTMKIITIDTLLSLAIGLYVAYLALPDTGRAITVLLACFASALPDIVEAPYFLTKMKSKTIEKWVKFQKSIQTDTDILPGLLTQTVTVIAAFWWILS